MSRLAQLPDDTIFFTQITMEAAEDPDFLDAMKAARIKGALVGVESVTPAGLKDVYKDFNLAGERLIERLRTFRRHGVHVLGSFIFGLPSDRPETFDATAAAAISADLAFAQFVMLSPYPGTVDFNRWEKDAGQQPTHYRWRSPYSTVAYTTGASPQTLLGPPGNVSRGNSFAHPGGLGPLLQLRIHLEALELHQVQPRAPGLCSDLEDLPPNVCRYRHRNR